MRFEWEDEIEFGHYECCLYDDNEKKLESISFWDYSAANQVEYDERNKSSRPYAYEIRWCNGSSYHESLDIDEHYRDHYGWHGVKEHTVEDVKHWCENFLAKRYIFDYEEELAKLNRLKSMSDWFVANGYGDRPEEYER